MHGSVLITGASSGLGLVTAVHLSVRGFRVFATMRDLGKRAALEAEAARQGVRLEILPLDVTDRRSIRTAVETVVSSSGGIDNLVSNAGIQVRGYFEDVSEEEMERVFLTNVFGGMALSREVLPHMRRAGKGRIVLISSVAGRIGSLGLSAYSSSKYALEGFGECLALEVAPLGIRVSLVEPGIVNTDIWGKNRLIAPGGLDPASPYYNWFAASERLADSAVRSSPTKPLDVAEAVFRALTDRRPRLRYVVGRRATLFLSIQRLLPSELFNRLYSKVLVNQVTKPKASKG